MNEDRISRHDAERILREAASGPRPGQDPLTAFLAAAAGPARDDELAGEEAAVTAFRAARGAARTRRRLPIAQVLTVKAAVALGLTATAAGGVALAAGTGALPGPLGDRQPAVERTSSNPATGGQLTTSRHPGGAGGPGGTPGTGEPAPSSPLPSPTAASPAGPKPPAKGRDNDEKDKGSRADKRKPTPPGKITKRPSHSPSAQRPPDRRQGPPPEAERRLTSQWSHK